MSTKSERDQLYDLIADHIVDAKKRIAMQLPTLIDRLTEIAVGVTVKEENAETERVYSCPPDRRALEFLMNRVMGHAGHRPEIRHTYTPEPLGGQTAAFGPRRTDMEVARQYLNAHPDLKE